MVYGPPPSVQARLVPRQGRSIGTASHASRPSTAFQAVGPRGVRVTECLESSSRAAIVRFPVGLVDMVGGRPL